MKLKKKYGKTRFIIKSENNIDLFNAEISSIYNISMICGQTVFEQKIGKLTIIFDFKYVEGKIKWKK